MALTDGGKEQVKLRASLLNSMAVTFFSIGVLAPIISSVYIRQIPQEQAFLAVATAAVCFAMTFGLHISASEHLREIDK